MKINRQKVCGVTAVLSLLFGMVTCYLWCLGIGTAVFSALTLLMVGVFTYAVNCGFGAKN